MMATSGAPTAARRTRPVPWAVGAGGSSIGRVRASHPDGGTHRLAAVLLPPLEAAMAEAGRDGAAAHRGAGRASRLGALAILPAVLALRDLQGAVSAPWDGTLHRRCSLRLLNRPRPQCRARGRDLNNDVAQEGDPGRPVLTAVRRAGWELMRAESVVTVRGRSWLVRNELARRLTHAQHAGAQHSGNQRSGAVGAAREPGSCRGGPAATAAAGVRPGRPEAGGTPVPVRLGMEDLQAWASASGDHNALHLRAGEAARAGLDVGPQEVIAHGLLLGALSLALEPPDTSGAGREPAPAIGPGGPAGRTAEAVEVKGAVRADDDAGAIAPAWEYDLRFPAPLAVPAAVPGHGLCLVDQDGCCADSGRSLVMVRV